MNSSMCFGSGALAEYAVIGSRPSATATSMRPSVASAVGAAVLVDLPVHERRVPVDDLHPVHADVAAAGLRVVRDHGRQRDERRRVARPAALDRQQRRGRRRRPCSTISWHAPVAHRLRARVGDDLSFCRPRTFSISPVGGCISRTSATFAPTSSSELDAEREAHPPLGAELVDQERMLGALRVLEQERRPAGLDGAVDDLGDLEVGIDLGGDAHELALALEQRDPVAEILRGTPPSVRTQDRQPVWSVTALYSRARYLAVA